MVHHYTNQVQSTIALTRTVLQLNLSHHLQMLGGGRHLGKMLIHILELKLNKSIIVYSRHAACVHMH